MNFLRIADFHEQQILEIFRLADDLKAYPRRQELAGKTIIVFFPESSIRTRLTFEKGISQLGGHSLLFHPDTLDKREALQDVIHYIENWADMAIVRHNDLEKLLELAEHASIPIINAMTALNHPCEILSDLYSLRNMRKNYRELTYTFVGEKGNISRTWAETARVLDLRFNHVCYEENRIQPDNKNYTFYTELDDILPFSDIILTDPLSERYRNDDYYRRYQITRERMASARTGALLNPCPPFFRGEEISSDATESPYFVGYQFKENLLYVQQAIMLYCLHNSSRT